VLILLPKQDDTGFGVARAIQPVARLPARHSTGSISQVRLAMTDVEIRLTVRQEQCRLLIEDLLTRPPEAPRFRPDAPVHDLAYPDENALAIVLGPGCGVGTSATRWPMRVVSVQDPTGALPSHAQSGNSLRMKRSGRA
jgi:hypothetical protein